MWNWILPFYLSIKAALAVPIPVQSSPENQPLCLRPQLSIRSSQTSCPIRYVLSNQDFVCVSLALWNSARLTSTSISASSPWGCSLTLDPFPRVFKTHFGNQTLHRLHSFSPDTLSHTFSAHPLSAFESIKIKLFQVVERQRDELSVQIRPVDPLGVFRKLFIGENSSELIEQILGKLGFVHLLNATGIHLYALALFCFAIVQFSFRILNIPVESGMIVARSISLILWIWAWLLSGARLGMLRPLVIVLLRSAALFLGVRWKKYAPLLISLALDLTFATYLSFTHKTYGAEILDAGRWVYALAVGGSVLLGTNSSHLKLAFVSWILAGIYEAYHSGCVALLTPFFSLLTIVIYAQFIFPLGLLSSLSEINFLKHLFQETLKRTSTLLEKLIHLAEHLPSFWIVSFQGLAFGFLLAWICSYLMSLFPNSKKKIIVICIGIALGLRGLEAFSTSKPISLELSSAVYQLDVGQGDAALLRYSNHQGALIDTGSSFALSPNQWLELFSQYQITHLKWVLLTHWDEDHSGGLKKLAHLITIDHVIVPPHSQRSQQKEAELKKLGFSLLKPNESKSLLKRDGVLLHPLNSKSHTNNADMNLTVSQIGACGLYINGGDAVKSKEPEFAAWVNSLQESSSFRILKLNHHGSKTSNTERFLKAIHPKVVWISSGIGNRYGHPSYPVLNTLHRLKLKIKRTDQLGTLTFDAIKECPKKPLKRLKQQSSAINDENISRHP